MTQFEPTIFRIAQIDRSVVVQCSLDQLDLASRKALASGAEGEAGICKSEG